LGSIAVVGHGLLTASSRRSGAQNSVDTGIHPKPNFNTGGDGAVAGLQEVRFNVTFSDPIGRALTRKLTSHPERQRADHRRQTPRQ
jgi:hypothetical protein